jgi:hypothetical protein
MIQSLQLASKLLYFRYRATQLSYSNGRPDHQHEKRYDGSGNQKYQDFHALSSITTTAFVGE